MGGSPHSPGGLGNACTAASSNSSRPVGLVCEPCKAVGWTYAQYDDVWNTPISLAPITVYDINGAVIDEGGCTMGLATFGLEDGTPHASHRNELGTYSFQAQEEGRLVVAIEPVPSGREPSAIQDEILAALQAFAASMEAQIEPWIQEWESRGWRGLFARFIDQIGEGLSTWWEGEGEFWTAVWQWFKELPDMAEAAWDGAVAGARELWERRDDLLTLIQNIAEGEVDLFQAGMDALAAVIARLPGLDDIKEAMEMIVFHSAEWAGAMNEMVRHTPRALTALAGTIIGTLAIIPPNFWTDMIGFAGGFLIPEIIITILFAIIAYFSAGVGAAGLAQRLTRLVTRLENRLNALSNAIPQVDLPTGARLAAPGQMGNIFGFMKSLKDKYVELIDSLRSRISLRSPGATGEATPLIRPVRRLDDPADLPCFNKPRGVSDAEFRAQLDEQMEAINGTDIRDIMQRRALVREHGTDAFRDRNAQSVARDAWMRDRVDELIAEGDLEEDALATALEEIAGLDATHTLDIIAGGDAAIISGLQNRTVNRSLGSQWRSRVDALDAALEDQASRGATYPNVRMNPC